MFNFFSNKLSLIYSHFTAKLGALFNKSVIDRETLNQLEQLLVEADTGIMTTRAILKEIEKDFSAGVIKHGVDLKNILKSKLREKLTEYKKNNASIYMLVGINGSGKTTTVAKLAQFLTEHGKKVLVAGADTFRAAATHQLAEWAKKVNVDMIQGNENQDPGAVVFNACQQFVNGNYDVLIIDTSGRLQTKINLMHELTKLKNIILKKLPQHSITTLITIDAMLGQNSLHQAEVFHQSTQLDGVILTKMDGTGKGGVVFAINQTLGIPVAFVTYGEKAEELKVFNPTDYIDQLLEI